MDPELVNAFEQHEQTMDEVINDLYTMYTPYNDTEPFLNEDHIRYTVVQSAPAAGDLDEGEVWLGESTGQNGEDELFFSVDGNTVSRIEASGTIS